MYVETIGNEQSPEQRLCRATICRALLDVFSENADRINKQDALRWIMRDDESLISFVFCCEVCDLDPKSMRGFVKAALLSGRITNVCCSEQYVH